MCEVAHYTKNSQGPVFLRVFFCLNFSNPPPCKGEKTLSEATQSNHLNIFYMEFTLILERNLDNSYQTLGSLSVVNEFGKTILLLNSLELPYLLNEPRVSSIPTGKYVIKPHLSATKGKCLLVLDVPNRSNILIHSGNYKSDTLGCIIVGIGTAFLNDDQYPDVINSRKAMASLLAIIDKPTTILVAKALGMKNTVV
jgi:hypothetical protein